MATGVPGPETLAEEFYNAMYGHWEQVGLLIDGVEFIPLDIVRKHLPFAAPPDVKVQAVYVFENPED